MKNAWARNTPLRFRTEKQSEGRHFQVFWAGLPCPQLWSKTAKCLQPPGHRAMHSAGSGSLMLLGGTATTSPVCGWCHQDVGLIGLCRMSPQPDVEQRLPSSSPTSPTATDEEASASVQEHSTKMSLISPNNVLAKPSTLNI